MKAKRWINLFLLFSFLTILFIGSINYIIDPLWTFKHSNKFNNTQDGFDEREQKSNFIFNNGLKDFNGILLGSSRSTFINQNSFRNMKIYNYALNAMKPNEYKDYINFAKKSKDKDFEYIIIGLDFFGTNLLTEAKIEKPQYYINTAQSSFYKYKMLLSLSTLKKSFKNIKNSLFGEKLFYDRNNIKYQSVVSESERIKRFSMNMISQPSNFNGAKYIYNNEYINILKELKNENPNTKFIIFTSAITSDLLVSILKDEKRINEYERWLKETLEVFTEINHFMTINSITTNLNNYPDADHAYPNIVSLIAKKLSEKNSDDIPKDFGVLLTKGNIDNYIEGLKVEINNYK
ncbi:MAG: hypothetical protein WCR78_05625 [Arcobacteraceae bacterium]